ncbi:Os01g0199351 [Oryza sativa Japonica Group]|uniref:Os01g0199351 protein n=1 Tax=Oryza sativa subsp. japonica TaxID=39947 RepID=A0A0N7KCI2_ORYSJ|nr:Os01g0199351 [Oryza sativa Japonica Group]
MLKLAVVIVASLWSAHHHSHIDRSMANMPSPPATPSPTSTAHISSMVKLDIVMPSPSLSDAICRNASMASCFRPCTSSHRGDS